MSRGSFALATPHYLATEAGAEAFRAGGNALDAAVSAAAALTVVYPHNCAVGGDIIALVHRQGGHGVVVNSTGAAAASESARDLRRTHTRMPVSGPRTVTVPGAVAAWDELLRLGGRRTLAAALEAAVVHAEEGVPVARSLAGAIDRHRPQLAIDEGMREVFLPDGAAPSEGATLRQPALGRTMRAIAAGGPPVLYGGAVGARFVEHLRRLGSRLTVDDLEMHRPELAAPVASRFGGREVLTAPPNSQGFVLLEILAALEMLDGDLALDGADAGVLARLFALTAADRDRYLADPRHAEVPLGRLLSSAHARRQAAAAISARPRPLRSEGAPLATGDTIAVVAADADGNSVSVIQSVFSTFGAGILDPQTGIISQNRGSGFSLHERSPNVVAAGKRPAHTLMPVLVRDGMRVVGVNGTMGGPAQAQIHTHLLLAALAGASPQEAVSAPRWTLGGLGDGMRQRVIAEHGVSAAAVASIEAAGFHVERVGELAESVGHAQAITRTDAGLLAGSDPRADGAALVI